MRYWFCHSVLSLRRRPFTLHGLPAAFVYIFSLGCHSSIFNKTRVIHVRRQLTPRSTCIYTHHNIFMRIEDGIRSLEAGVAVQLAATRVRVHPSKVRQVWLLELRWGGEGHQFHGIDHVSIIRSWSDSFFPSTPPPISPRLLMLSPPLRLLKSYAATEKGNVPMAVTCNMNIA